MKRDKDLDKIFSEFQKYLDKTGKTFDTDKEFDAIFEEFMRETDFAAKEALIEDDSNIRFTREPMDEFDCLERAWNSENPEEALMYAKKALKFNKNNLDAQQFVAEITAESDDDLQKKYARLIKKAEKQLTADGFFDDDAIGSFWGIWETRPYMRLRAAYMEHLVHMGKRRKAILECEELIRLSENDNMGVRFKLMHLYAFYEDELSALKLFKKYDGGSQTMMLLPLILLYYRLDDYTHAKKYLLKLCDLNPEAEEFFAGDMDSFEDPDAMAEKIAKTGMVKYNSVEELISAMIENPYLYATTEGFPMWATEIVNKNLPF